MQKGRRHLNQNVTKSFMTTLSYSVAQKPWLLLFNYDLLVKNFPSNNSIYRRGNYVYHHWGYTSICRLLSYPLRSLV